MAELSCIIYSLSLICAVNLYLLHGFLGWGYRSFRVIQRNNKHLTCQNFIIIAIQLIFQTGLQCFEQYLKLFSM